MSEPSNELIYQTLLKQNEQLGRIEANVTSTSKAFEEHVKEDKLLGERLTKLEASNSRIKGGVTVLSFIVSGLVNVIGWYFGKH